MLKRIVRWMFVGQMTPENIPDPKVRHSIIYTVYSLTAYALYYQWRAYKAEEELFTREIKSIEELEGDDIEAAKAEIAERWLDNHVRQPLLNPGFTAYFDEDGVPQMPTVKYPPPPADEDDPQF